MCYKHPGPRCSAHAAKALTIVKRDARLIFNDPAVQKKYGGSYDAMKEALQKAQDDYDATPAGILELQRRVMGEGYDRGEKDRLALGILRRKEALQKIGIEDKGDYGDHQDSRLVEEEHEKAVQREFLAANRVRRAVPHDGEQVTQALVEGSAAWTAHLTPEELESVSWMTSNGFTVMRHHLDGREDPIWGYDTYSREMIDLNIAHVISAISKAPRLKKPVVIYRGIKGVHIFDDADKSAATTTRRPTDFGEVVSKFPVGSTVDLGPLPQSATLNPRTAVSFSDEVVLEIKTRTFASPANVSAWNTTEYEVFADPTRKYRVKAVKQNVPYETRGENAKITVVQLEEIDD